VQHEGEQAERLGLLGQELRDEPREPHAFLGEAPPPRHGAGRVGPAFGECRIDRLEHRFQPLGELRPLGHAERDAGLADARLRAHEALAHGCRRDQERRGNARRVEAEHGLKDQRRTHRTIDRRMRAGEHQSQPLVRNRHFTSTIAQLLGEQQQRLRGVLARAAAACSIDQAMPRDREQPGFRRARHAARGPSGERRGEGLGQRVLGPRDVASARGEDGEQLAIARAGDRLGGARYAGVQSGRTSIAPCTAPGQRDAQESAASRSGTSIR
jgi:hypothetical protein